MTNLFQIPKQETSEGLTFEEAMLEMLNKTEEENKKRKVDNLIIIALHKDSFSFGALMDNNPRLIVGTLEMVKQILLDECFEQD